MARVPKYNAPRVPQYEQHLTKKLIPTWSCIYGKHDQCRSVEDYSRRGPCGCDCHNFCTCSCHETANHP